MLVLDKEPDLRLLFETENRLRKGNQCVFGYGNEPDLRLLLGKGNQFRKVSMCVGIR